MLRVALPFLFMFLPQFLPGIIRFIRLVWRLQFDKRVPLVLRLLVPLALVYFVWPFDLIRDSIPIWGRVDDALILALALLFLTRLAPKHLVEEHQGTRRSENLPYEKDPSKVVEGKAHVIDDDQRK